MILRRFTRSAVIAVPRTLLVVAGACSFFDPLGQVGLRVLLSPSDTALYVGAHFKTRGLMVNSYGDQYPSDHLRYASLDPSVSVAGEGTVTGLAYGRARVVVTRADLSDSSWVSVVPVGTLALSKISDQPTVDVVNTDGSGLMSIVSGGGFGSGAPAWLPGNAGLVYQVGGGGVSRLFVTDLAGHNTLLVPFGQDPRVSRDGRWVYFRYALNGGEIWRVHVDGTGLEQVTVSPSSTAGDGFPDPSPDGTQLVFMSTRFAGGGFQLAVRDLTSGAERSLGSEGELPRWAPSGNSIAFWSGNVSSQTGTIFVIGADGTGARQVSTAGRTYVPQGLDWSPDGQWLLARSDSTLDLIQVATGLTLPLGYGAGYFLASWRW